MKSLKGNWAQIVCWVVVVGSLGWASYTIYASGLDDSTEERSNRDTVSDVKNLEGKIESGSVPEIGVILTPKPAMMPTVPPEVAPPVASITNSTAPHPFFITGTPVKSGVVEEVKIDTNLPKAAKEVKVPAYIQPAHLEVYQVSTGNELVVYLPWPEDRSMMAVTGFVIQRMEMRKNQQNAWVTKNNAWVNLPKYMVADEAKAGATAAPAGPAAPVAPVAPVRPAGLMGGGAAPAGGGVAAGGGLGGGAPAPAGFDMKKFQGVYVLFDKIPQDDQTRYVYRVAMIGKQMADAVEKDFSINGAVEHAIPYIPAAISVAYPSNGQTLTVFAPGETVEPTFTGKIQVKFVSSGDDATKANFIVMRGLSASAIVEVTAGQEIAAELPVVDEKGRPVIDEGGNKKETLQTGLTFARVELDTTIKKNVAYLTDAKGVETKIEQGKTNGNPKEPEVDLKLLNQVLTEREKEFKKLFNTTWDKCDPAVPVPAKTMKEAKGDLQLVPNEYYPSVEDDTTPSATWPQITISPREQVIKPIPKAVKPPPVVSTPRPPTVVNPPTMPPDAGVRGPYGGGPDHERPVYQEKDQSGTVSPDGIIH